MLNKLLQLQFRYKDVVFSIILSLKNTSYLVTRFLQATRRDNCLFSRRLYNMTLLRLRNIHVFLLLYLQTPHQPALISCYHTLNCLGVFIWEKFIRLSEISPLQRELGKHACIFPYKRTEMLYFNEKNIAVSGLPEWLSNRYNSKALVLTCILLIQMLAALL